MLCQRCNQREATIHVAQMAGDVLREVHLCSDCARRQLMPDMLTGKQLLEQLMQNQSTPQMTCPVCGTTLADFQRTGYVGCPQCYEVFQKQIEPMLLAVHGATGHVAQAPMKKDDTVVKEQDAIVKLRAQLNKAVEEERYEQAAVLRDKLRQAEQEAMG